MHIRYFSRAVDRKRCLDELWSLDSQNIVPDDRDVLEDNMVEAKARPRPWVFEVKAKTKTRSFRIKATYTYKSYMTNEVP